MSNPPQAFTGDPTQTAFLSALALGESGSGGASAQYLGYGGINLSGAATDKYGFPQWGGGSSSAGPTHAAGIFQFQPSTWDYYASKYNLNFGSVHDQEAAAWYDAQDKFSHATNGGSLEQALQAGDYQTVQNALAGEWTSVIGSRGNPGGLARALASGAGANLGGSGANLSGALPAQSDSNAASADSSSGGILGWGIDKLQRFGLIAVGSVIIFVALWYVLSNNGVVPSPGDTARIAGRAISEA